MNPRIAALRAAATARGPLPPGPQAQDEVVIERPKASTPTLPTVVLPKTQEGRVEAASGSAGLDCETFLIQPGRAAPRLVVTGYQAANGAQAVVTKTELLVDGVVTPLRLHAAEYFSAFMRHCLATRTKLVNQNIPYDFVVHAADAFTVSETLGDEVLCAIFDLLDADLVEDTMLRERLIDLAEGTLGRDFGSVTKDGNPRRKRYALKGLAKAYLDVDLDKTSWRLGYAAKVDTPVMQWESGARDYVVGDVETALQVATQQGVRAGQYSIPNSTDQSRAAFGFALMSSWGIRTDMAKVRAFDVELDREARRFERVVREAGLIRSSGRDAGKRDMKRVRELVSKTYTSAGLDVPETDGGAVSTAGAVLEDVALIALRNKGAIVENAKGEVDETKLFEQPLYAYSQLASIQKLQTTYLPVLFQGGKFPINARYETLVETGRVSCYQPNLMNLPRGGSKTLLQRLQSKVRECFVPRPGFVFCSVDYDTLELRTLAQVCIWLLGFSKLGDALNAGLDPHLLLAAEQFLRMPYEEALKRKKEKHVAEMRNAAKPFNFGVPGGMGAEAFQQFAKDTYNIYFTIEECRDGREKYLAQWAEMRPYFKIIGSMMRGIDDKGQTIGDIEQFVSGRIRGRTRYTAACNTMFQGLAADGAKAAVYALQKECYLRRGRLFGSRPVVFIHDEVIVEHPEDCASERAQIQTEIQCSVMQTVVPDIKITASPALMRCWYKGADAVYEGGKLVPWEPT